MPMSKKDFIAAAQMIREINGQTARKVRLVQDQVGRGNSQDYARGFNDAMVTAQWIVLEEVIALCKRCRSSSSAGFKEETFRNYVEGR